MTDVLAVFGDYAGFVQACRARRIQLGLSQLEVDHRAGMPSGYTAKIELSESNPTAKNARSIGKDSWPLLLGALGLNMAVLTAGKHQTLSRDKPLIRMHKTIADQSAHGGNMRAAKLSSAKRSKIARKAARARWEKARTVRCKG